MSNVLKFLSQALGSHQIIWLPLSTWVKWEKNSYNFLTAHLYSLKLSYLSFLETASLSSGEMRHKKCQTNQQYSHSHGVPSSQRPWCKLNCLSPRLHMTKWIKTAAAISMVLPVPFPLYILQWKYILIFIMRKGNSSQFDFFCLLLMWLSICNKKLTN